MPQLELGAASAYFSAPQPPTQHGCIVLPPGLQVPPVQGFGAGRITVRGAATPIQLDPIWDAERQSWDYRSNLPEDAAPFFDGGETLVVSGGGGRHVGPFSGQVSAPPPVTVMQPSMLLPVTRNAALTVRWTTVQGSSAVITVTPMAGDFSGQPMEGNFIVCVTDDNGSLTVPQNSMAQLPAAAGGVIVSVTGIRQQRLEVDSHTSVVLMATTSGGTLAYYEIPL